MTKTHTALTRRINNVRGQLQGITEMIERDEDCIAVLTQFKAARAGLDSALRIFLEENVKRCMGSKLDDEKSNELSALLKEFIK